MIFALFDGCEVLDFTGPLQAFHEANAHGAQYAVKLCGIKDRIVSAQGATFAELAPLPEAGAGTLVVVPGFLPSATRIPRALVRWLQMTAKRGAEIASVCTGSFVLGDAGLLDGVRCTTHWRRIAELRNRFPRADVAADCLFVVDGPIISSAGITAGIDMALHLIERDYGPQLAAKVAREMVVYMRRNGNESQQSVFTDCRTHLNARVHDVQDYLLANPAKKITLPQLARIAGMSSRNLTRTFREATGMSLGQFRTKVRLELARTLLEETTLPLEAIAGRCGFSDARQLRRSWSSFFRYPPSRVRKLSGGG